MREGSFVRVVLAASLQGNGVQFALGTASLDVIADDKGSPANLHDVAPALCTRQVSANRSSPRPSSESQSS